MTNHEYIEGRLREWCEWLQWRDYLLEPRHLTVEQWIFEANHDRTRKPPPSSFLARIFRKTANSVPCKETRYAGGDGGMGAMLERFDKARGFDRRGREIDVAVRCLPDIHRAVIMATYNGPPKEAPRSGRSAAVKAGVAETTYRRLYSAATAKVYEIQQARKHRMQAAA